MVTEKPDVMSVTKRVRDPTGVVRLRPEIPLPQMIYILYNL